MRKSECCLLRIYTNSCLGEKLPVAYQAAACPVLRKSGVSVQFTAAVESSAV